jgi:ferritin-like metal-binding protein YciE
MTELFVDELKDILDAEKQLVKALPKMAKAAASEKLQAAITDHLAQTKEHVNRLERVFQSLDMAARGKHCAAMEGLIEEGKEVIEMDLEDAVRDAGLIGAAQKVEHYEIASYGTLIAHARRLGHDEAVTQLQQTLDEEKQTNDSLTELAESEVNVEACEVG